MKFKILTLLLCLSTILLGEPSSKTLRGEYESLLPEGKVSGTFIFDLKVGNETVFTQKSDIIESTSHFDSKSRFISMTRELKGIKGVNEDFFKATLSANSKVVDIEYSLDGEKVDNKRIKTKGDFRIFNNLYFTLQRDLKREGKDFNTLLIFPENGTSYKASFKFYKTRMIVKEDTPYRDIPDFFLKGTIFPKEVNLCEVSLIGIPGKFFPYKFSFIFDDSEEKSFLGYWGGHPDNPNYFLVKD